MFFGISLLNFSPIVDGLSILRSVKLLSSTKTWTEVIFHVSVYFFTANVRHLHQVTYRGEGLTLYKTANQKSTRPTQHTSAQLPRKGSEKIKSRYPNKFFFLRASKTLNPISLALFLLSALGISKYEECQQKSAGLSLNL